MSFYFSIFANENVGIVDLWLHTTFNDIIMMSKTTKIKVYGTDRFGKIQEEG